MIRIIKNIRRKKLFFRKISANNKSLVLFPTAVCQNSGKPEDIKIGDHCTLGCLFQTFFGGKISIGENTYIGPNTIIQSKESISIGNCVIIANNVIIVDNNNHPTSSEMRMKMSHCDDFLNDELWSWKYADSKPIIIEDNVWIGRDSRILKGVRIGKGSIVALGSIVVKDVPPNVIVAGNPAKVVKKLERCDNEKN